MGLVIVDFSSIDDGLNNLNIGLFQVLMDMVKMIGFIVMVEDDEH